PYYGGRAVELYCAAGTVADRLDDADLSAIVAEVEAEWDAWPIEQRARAAIVLGARAPSLVARTLEAPSYPGEVLSLSASISDVADAQRLMERLDKTSASAQLAACVLLVVRRGVDAAPILLAVAQRLNEVHTIVE